MKILFVVKSKEIETLGVMYLAAVVKQCGHEARIVDIHFNKLTIINTWKPDIIGYSIMTGDMEKFKQLNNELKSYINFTSIVGGPDPTFVSQGYDWTDMIIPGEAEQSISDLLQSGIKYPDINSFPYPDRTDFPNHRIRDFIASRGCASSCAYCYNDKFAKMFSELPRIRIRSVDDVIKEINNINPEFVYFQDSCFGVNIKWLKEFSNKYRYRINIPFHCHLRPNQINEDKIVLLNDAGCMSIRIALESASNRLREVLNRGKMNINEVSYAAKLCRKWDIKLMIQNMIGIPTGTIEDDLETLELNIKCKPAYAWCSIYQPYPGTELGDRCKKEGWYTGDYSEITDCFFDTSVLNFTPEYIEQLEVLQKIFALCVEAKYMPDTKELTHDNIPKLVHKIMRRVGDKRLYGGII